MKTGKKLILKMYIEGGLLSNTRLIVLKAL